MLNKLLKMDKALLLKNTLWVVLGTLSIAFATALFLTKLNIVAGGVSGIAIIIQHHLPKDFLNGQAIDLIAGVISWALWVVGLIFLGKSFALQTLISTILYPLFLSLFLRVPFFVQLSESIGYYGLTSEQIAGLANGTFNAPIGNLLICGIFAGALVGSGVAFTFRGGGSSGGVDIIIALVRKYTGIKESVVSFIVDASIIVSGAIFIPHNIIPALCGVITAFVTAWMIEYIYIGTQTAYQADIISSHWEKISRFVQDDLGRGATIIDAKGGYHGSPKIILRVVFPKSQLRTIKEFIRKVDPKAFITFTQTYGVTGEGFDVVEIDKRKK